MKRHMVSVFGFGALLLLPLFASAQTTVQSTLVQFLYFLNYVFIPFLFAVAVFFIIWNLFRFFILKGGTEEGQDQGKRLILYGILGLVLMVSLWGIVRIGINALDARRTSAPCPDYLPNCYAGGSGGSGGSGSNRYFDLLDPGAGIQTR